MLWDSSEKGGVRYDQAKFCRRLYIVTYVDGTKKINLEKQSLG